MTPADDALVTATADAVLRKLDLDADLETQMNFVEIRDEVLAASTNAAAAVRPGDQPFAKRLFLHAMDRVGPSTSDEIELLGMQGFVTKVAEELAESERESGGPIWPSYFTN